ncbi:MAG: Uma2 family endonuclease [Caldilineaceae bacterium]|nr:Uma2 family endonuclease [Caldilineaceae bacterium]
MATVEKLSLVQQLADLPNNGKAEIVNGKIVRISPTGFMPAYAAGEIYASLRDYARRTGSGIALGDNVGFLVDLPHRRSFSPDAAFFTGTLTGMKFLQGAPSFAVEVRSEGDYGPAAEESIAAKRRDYFAAGTLVVWDVDLLHEDVVSVYRQEAPNRAVVYRRGTLADAEPAVPGWRLAVNDLFLEP